MFFLKFLYPIQNRVDKNHICRNPMFCNFALYEHSKVALFSRFIRRNDCLQTSV